jgi:hypothetical protein
MFIPSKAMKHSAAASLLLPMQSLQFIPSMSHTAERPIEAGPPGAF